VSYVVSERVFYLRLMLSCLLSFEACTVKPCQSQGHYTVSGTVVHNAVIVNVIQDISVGVVTRQWAGLLRSEVLVSGKGKS
jgi:hypothetical protein